MKRMIGVLCCGLVLGSMAMATSIRRLNFSQLVDESELVLYGRVLDTHSYLMPSRGCVLKERGRQMAHRRIDSGEICSS
jgi:hypothetical protein